MEQKLADLKFDTGKVDGSFDAATGHAVMAFQKAFGPHAADIQKDIANYSSVPPVIQISDIKQS